MLVSLIEWLLDLDNIRLGHDAPLILRWNSPLEAWMLFGFSLLAFIWIALNYRREQASRKGRIACAAVRCAIVALVIAVICRPSLILQRNRIEPSYTVLAVDGSQSMASKDRYADDSFGRAVAAGASVNELPALENHTRLDLVKASLLGENHTPLAALLARNDLQICSFTGHLEKLGFFTSHGDLRSAADALTSIDAVGSTTDPAAAIREIIENTQGRRLAAIVLASDGQSTQLTSLKDALDLARGHKVPVFPLRIGSPRVPRDIEVGPIRSRDNVFVNDVLAIESSVRATGLTAPTAITVQLLDALTNELLDTELVVLDAEHESATVELRTIPDRPGQARYVIQVPPIVDEHATDNNSERIDIGVLDSHFSVLYVEGSPRYEYRYLKNALLREKTMKLSVLLIGADDQFVQEGTDPIRRFPETPEELNRFDVVLFGDIDPRGGWLTQAQTRMLLDFVGNQGGGFGLIAGERSAPSRLIATPLERLIPVRIDPSFEGISMSSVTTGFQPRLTREGRRSRIFRFAEDREESERLFEALPELYWLARTLGPKPGASVLMEHPTMRYERRSDAARSNAMPIVVTGRYGAGKLLFLATDDTWRWRRHTGEFLHDAFWIQVLRELMPSARVAQTRRLTLRTDRRVYPFGSAVQFQVQITDSQLLAEQGETVTILISEVDGPGSDSLDTSRPTQSAETLSVVSRVDVHRIGEHASRFEGAWVPPRPGRFVAQLADIAPQPGERPVRVTLRVERPDLEARRPEADHASLQRIAAATNGKVLELDQLESGFRAIRDRSVQIPDDVEEPLWDSRLVLMLFVTMISMEWVIRKIVGLL